jgi:hypothetical protein
VGAKIRRWWYRTNNWTLPTGKGAGFRRKMGSEKLAKEMGDVSLTFLREEGWW